MNKQKLLTASRSSKDESRIGKAILTTPDLCAPVAQRLEQQTHNLLVRGSNPCGGTNYLVSAPTFLSLSLTLVIAVVHLVLLLGKIRKTFPLLPPPNENYWKARMFTSRPACLA